MHLTNLHAYTYVDDYNVNLINNLSKNVSIIYRNYKETNIDHILKIKKLCKKKKIKFYLSNNVKLAIKLNIDGAYIPAFNKSFSHKSYNLKKKFKLIGSAHNLTEIKVKEKQGVSSIFLSSIFKNNKSNKFLGIYRFFKLMKLTKKNVVCLGGINKDNIKKITLLKIDSIASISMFHKL